MRIGIDIDGVLTNDDDYILDNATKFCYENNLDFYNNPYDYETRKFNWNSDILERYREKYFWNYVINEPPRKYSQEVLQMLKNDGYKIYIITSRHLVNKENEDGNKMRSFIIEWLDKYRIPYDKICFSSDKTVQIKEYKIDVMIEDSPETIPVFVEHTHVFCYDCRYNVHLKLSNMTRVFSWYDIYDKIKKYNK